MKWLPGMPIPDEDDWEALGKAKPKAISPQPIDFGDHDFSLLPKPSHGLPTVKFQGHQIYLVGFKYDCPSLQLTGFRVWEEYNSLGRLIPNCLKAAVKKELRLRKEAHAKHIIAQYSDLLRRD